MPHSLDREPHAQQDAREDECVHEPRRSEEERELHDVLRLQKQERRAHEREIDVEPHPAEHARSSAGKHDQKH